MAVTLTVAELAGALRLGDSTEETTEVTRLLAYATEAVNRYAPGATDAPANEATIRLAAYLFDQPNAGRGVGFANALRNSGAAAMLLPYKVVRAGSTAEAVAAAQQALGTAGNPVTNVTTDIAGATLTVHFADGTSRTENLPAGGMGGSGVDTTARTAATAAKQRADDAFTAAGLAHNQANVAAQTAAANATAVAGKQATLMPPSTAEAENGTATTIRGWTAKLVRAAINAVVPTWARAGNTARIPESKIEPIHIYESATAPSADTGGDEHDIWFRPTATGIEIYLYNGTAWAKRNTIGLPNRITGDAVNINESAYILLPEGGHVMEIRGGRLKVYRRNDSGTAPFLELLGSTTSGGGINPNLLEAFAFQGNDATVDLAKMPFSVPSFLTDPLNHDIPYSFMDGLLETWAVIVTQASRDAGNVPQLIPNERLPVARFVPSPTGLDDGLVATIEDGVWTAAVAAGTASTTSKQWRFDFVPGEDTADPIAAAGMVFIELRYLDSYNAMGVRVSVQDVGAGFLAADGSRVLSSSGALDVRGLLAQSSISAIIKLVQNLPTAGTATWGEWYGLADTAGRVKDIYYRREESRTEQLWLPARLQAQNRNLHGFSTLNSTLTYGYERGGALSPEAGVIELVEELDAGGNYTTRVIVPNDGPLNSLISVILFWKSGGQSNYTTSREIPLFHDTSWLSSETNRYVSAVYTDEFKFTPGASYTIKWRNAGSVHDLVIQPAEHMRRVVDDEELDEATARINRELYEVEDRVAALESTPSGGGGVAQIGSDVNVSADGSAYFADAATAAAFVAAWNGGNYKSFIFEFAEKKTILDEYYQVQLHRTFDTIQDGKQTEFQAGWNWTFDTSGPFRILVNRTGAAATMTLQNSTPVVFESGTVLSIYGVAT